MNKRSFIKVCTVSAGGLISYSSLANSVLSGRISGSQSIRIFKLPELPYSYDSLAPFIDAQTMQIHYEKHHAGYVRKFNEAVKAEGIARGNAYQLLSEVSKYSEDIRNFGGGFFNHKLFWKCLSPNGGGKPAEKLLTHMEKDFGSFEAFKTEFSKAAASQFGSGWAWLIIQDNKLLITSSPNQDSPLMDIAEVRGFPLLTLDVWEHAYYLKYQNRRKEYINAFWSKVNWNFVAKRYQNYLNK